ncbi:ComF family protein [Oceanobacillus polygoni]|uniref:Competence protein ComFC n=1 Tax=Oceanobacillus polygoni TaxID=1235259 RepID=A0A9X0YUK2_9BACI|nr:ComF family protein [Oceanobacillus polygoni]MBP2078904.1 competence protein ComFC [Oceanobacillus polygoni]
MNCLVCQNEIILQIGWANLFQLSVPRPICEACAAELELLKGNRCRKCSRQLEEQLCSDCRSWEEHKEMDTIEFNYSIFAYNEKMQDIVATWKYRGDYMLGEIFREYVREAFKQKFSFIGKDSLAIPIPLSTERILERGFNQALQLGEFLPIEQANILSRIHGEKQSKKTRMERITTENPFFIRQPINKPVVLVDDIYTTGTTLRHAAQLLKQHGCPSVYAFTLIRG